MIITSRQEHSRRRIVAIGTFDGVHLGHRFLIEAVCDEASKLNLTPSVVTFSEHPRCLVDPSFCPEMLMCQQKRLNALIDAGAEDVILMPFDSSVRMMTAREFMRRLHEDYDVDALVMGFNHHFGHDKISDFNTYRKIGAQDGVIVISADEYVPDEAGKVSSSTIRDMIRDGRVHEAARLLGRPYAIEGSVVHGKGLGRTLGFPTANVVPSDRCRLIPGNGVYVADALLPDGDCRRAIVNIGHRPTVDGNGAPVSIEAHLLDYKGDLYGKDITIEFLRYLRAERRFDSLEELRRQLEADALQAKSM